MKYHDPIIASVKAAKELIPAITEAPTELPLIALKTLRRNRNDEMIDGISFDHFSNGVWLFGLFLPMSEAQALHDELGRLLNGTN